MHVRRLPSKCNVVVTFLLHRCYTVCCLIYRCPFFRSQNFQLPFYPGLHRCCLFPMPFFHCPMFPLPFLPLPFLVAFFSIAVFFTFYPLQIIHTQRASTFLMVPNRLFNIIQRLEMEPDVSDRYQEIKWCGPWYSELQASSFSHSGLAYAAPCKCLATGLLCWSKVSLNILFTPKCLYTMPALCIVI